MNFITAEKENDFSYCFVFCYFAKGETFVVNFKVSKEEQRRYEQRDKVTIVFSQVPQLPNQSAFFRLFSHPFAHFSYNQNRMNCKMYFQAYTHRSVLLHILCEFTTLHTFQCTHTEIIQFVVFSIFNALRVSCEMWLWNWLILFLLHTHNVLQIFETWVWSKLRKKHALDHKQKKRIKPSIFVDFRDENILWKLRLVK